MAPIILIITIGLLSVLFCLYSLRRLYKYIHKYRFDESKYTLVLGFLRLRYVATLYTASVSIFAVISIIFILLITK